MAKSKSGEHGIRHPVNWLAAEFGVSGTVLAHLLGSGQFTARQAYEALSGKVDRETDRRRRQKAEADTAEMIAAEKRGDLMLKEKAVAWFADFSTFVRAQIVGAKLPEDQKKRICTTISEWEPGKSNVP